MSDYRSEASSRSAVKTELTSAHLECLLISLVSGLFMAAVWMQTTARPCSRSSGAAHRMCRRLSRTAVARMSCCT